MGGGALIYRENPLLWCWANFEGIHFLNIAQFGYYQFPQAFFPLYPYSILSLVALTKNYLYSGLLISHASLIIALLLFYQLIRLDFSDKIAKRGLVYLLIFPTSFFLGSLYSEALFLALVLASFYSARREHWWIAGIIAALASATQFVGIFLFPALLVEWYLQKGKRKKKLTEELIECLPIFFFFTGFLFYMAYLKATAGDPLYFLHVRPFFSDPQAEVKLVLLYQVFWRYLKMLITVQKFTPTYFAVVMELLVGAAFLVFSIFAYLRRWFGYVTFMALAYLAPTLTGSFASLPRYALILFPGFILLAIWGEKYQWVRILYPLVALPFLIISILLFTRGYLVA